MARVSSLFTVSVLLTVLFATVCEADTIVFTNGRRLTGRVIAENDQVVEVEIRQDGAVLRSRVARSEVASIEREAAEGPLYCVLPVIGSIGPDGVSESYITADAFGAALAQVSRAKPEYVVLMIDSPGGSVVEMEGVVRLIREHGGGLRFVAYVKKNALSAAAVIALACPTIVMAPGARIGAAVPWQLGPEGTPDDIEEKFQSAVRASFRIAAECGGHSPLLAQGMIDAGIELAVEQRNGRPVVVEVVGAEEGKRTKLIKKRGQILTLTAAEARACGLSSGTAESLGAVKDALGLDVWHEDDRQAWHTLINLSKAQHPQHQEQFKRNQEMLDRQDQLERVRPQLEQVDARLNQVRIKMTDVAAEVRALMLQWDTERGAAKAQFQSALAQAHRTDRPQYTVDQATVEYNRKLASIEQRIRSKLGGLQRAWKELELEENQLVARRDELVKYLPPMP